MRKTRNSFAFISAIIVLAMLESCASTPQEESTSAPTKTTGQTQTTTETTDNTTQPAATEPESQSTIPKIKATDENDLPMPEKSVSGTIAPEQQTSYSQSAEKQALAIKLCEEIGSKLGSVSIDDCLHQQLIHSDLSIEGRSLAFRDFPPLASKSPLGRVLVIGGIHGDEFSSVSVLFKWMNILNEHHSGLFHWRFIPTMNPDGLLRKKSQRQNHNGVDLNRNFPTADWEEHAIAHWRTETHSNPRRHPGSAPASEPEIKWLVDQIDTFKPDVIISMHAPYHLVDYDGPPTAPNKLGSLYLRDLGVFPGSLGNYAGLDLHVPIVTVGVESAGIMPSRQEINTMWSHLVRWLRDQLTKQISDYEANEDVSELTFGQ